VAPFLAFDLMRERAIEVVIVKAKITKKDPIDASVTCSKIESGGRPTQIQLLKDVSLSVSWLGRPKHEGISKQMQQMQKRTNHPLPRLKCLNLPY